MQAIVCGTLDIFSAGGVQQLGIKGQEGGKFGRRSGKPSSDRDVYRWFLPQHVITQNKNKNKRGVWTNDGAECDLNRLESGTKVTQKHNVYMCMCGTTWCCLS